MTSAFKIKTPDVLRFRTGRELIYFAGFNTGSGTFQQLIDVRDGENHWITIPHEKFELLQKTGRAVFVPGKWQHREISAVKNQQAGRNQPSTATIKKGAAYGAAPTKKGTNSSRRGLNTTHNHNTAARSHGAGGFNFATVLAPIDSFYSHWRIGEVVKVISTRRGECMIERVKWKGKLPVLNRCAGVPLSLLKIHTQKS